MCYDSESYLLNNLTLKRSLLNRTITQWLFYNIKIKQKPHTHHFPFLKNIKEFVNERISSTLFLQIGAIFFCDFSPIHCAWQVSNYGYSPNTGSLSPTLQELLSRYRLSQLQHTYLTIVTY